MNARMPWDRNKGDSMTKHDEEARGQRRNFLKTAGGAALALVAKMDAHGQSEHSKAASQGTRRRDEPNDRGLWASWYDLPDNGRDAYLSWLHETYLPAQLK